MKIYLSHPSNYDFEHELYLPLRSSKLATDNEVLFPHSNENIGNNSKNWIQQSDVVIAEVSLPSTGQGIELGWAEDSNVPIICIHKKGSNISSSLVFITNDFIDYTDSTNLVQQLEDWFAAK